MSGEHEMVLKQLLQTRLAIGRLAGCRSFAEKKLKCNMAQSPAIVGQFLKSLGSK